MSALLAHTIESGGRDAEVVVNSLENLADPSLLKIWIAYLLNKAQSNLSKTVVSDPPTAVSVFSNFAALRV